MTLAWSTRMLVALVATGGAVWLARADEPPRHLKEARSAYEKARDKQRDELLRRFDDAVEGIGKQRQRGEERAKRVDVVNAERERFEKEGLIPWSEPMRHYLAGYQKNLKQAEDSLKKVYNTDIDKALRAKENHGVNQLRADLAVILDVKVVATWSHANERGDKEEIKLYSNGKMRDPDGGSAWAFRNGTLTLTWPNAVAPGGAWVDNCTVSADGRTYTGKNQSGIRVGGAYVAK